MPVSLPQPPVIPLLVKDSVTVYTVATAATTSTKSVTATITSTTKTKKIQSTKQERKERKPVLVSFYHNILKKSICTY